MIVGLKPYSAMKDSGVAWLGEVPKHWEVRRLKYLLRERDVRSADGAEQLLRVSQYTGVTQRKRADGLDEPDILEAIDMDSYRVEKQAVAKIQLPDADAEIEPVPATGGGRKPEPELDRLSNIIKAFNDQFGSIPWTDSDRVHKLITKDIPARVGADTAYQNARQNSDKQNARIEHDKALARVMTAVLKDDTELFKQFSDNEGFKKWLTDTVFALTYDNSGNSARPV